jgi:thiamine pyrophosphokinase
VNVLIVAAAPVAGSPELVARLAPEHDLIIAVDGGGAVCIDAGVSPDIVLGDFDSLDPDVLEQLCSRGTSALPFPADKDQTDLELALVTARERGASSVTVTAASSGRLDHTLAVVGAISAAADLRPHLVEPNLRAWVLGEAGRVELAFAERGSTISLVALGAQARVTLSGVRWPLHDRVLTFDSGLGISNVVTAESGAIVQLHAGRLLVLVPDAPGAVRRAVN